MTKHIVAAIALLAIGAPAAAQSTQEQLDQRYDLALAAGYKALFLCSAMHSMERSGRTRDPEHIERWELAGIDPTYAPYIAALPFREFRRDTPRKELHHIAVDWDEEMPPRIATVNYGDGCRIEQIGAIVDSADAGVLFEVTDRSMRARPRQTRGETAVHASAELSSVFERYLGTGSLDAPRTTAMLVLRNGERIGEAYAEGFTAHTTQRTWSVAKSLAATVVGANVHTGETDVNAPAIDGLHDNDPRKAITIDHLLRMASGRYSDTPGNRTNPIYWGGSAVRERARNWPLIHPPGTFYRYSNNDTLMAIEALDSPSAETPSNVFRAIGMEQTIAEMDWNSDYILSSQVWTSPNDLAKFGQLYLDNGVLPSGERILPEGWVEYVSSPTGPQPEGRDFGYGAGFWLLDNSDGVPPDTFAAMGNRGQFVVIVPSRNVVIVRRGEDPAGTRFDIAGFTRDVLVTLD